MKTRHLFFGMLSLLGSFTAHAYDAEINGIYYNLSEEATVTYQNYSNSTYSSNYAGDIVIPESITYNGNIYSVIAISNNAFFGCSNITSITVPESVKSIGYGAFDGCSGLTTLTLPESVNVNNMGESATFRNCSNLISLRIPHGLSQIYEETLEGCSNLQSLSIPGSVTYIYQNAFKDCTSLKEVRFEDGTSDIVVKFCWRNGSGTGGHAFYNSPLESVYLGRNLVYYETDGEYGFSPFYNKPNLTSVVIGSNVSFLNGNMFMSCKGLTSVSIPGNVKTIGSSAFKLCTNLNDLQLSEGLETIRERAFESCSNLTTVTFPNSLTTIGDWAFEAIGGLSCLDIPSGVTSIGLCSFGCGNLTSISVSPDNPIYDSRDNCNAIIYTEKDSMVAACVNTIFPNDLKSVGGFGGCRNLTSIVIPDGIKQISKRAFWDCSSLTTITIPESVTEIGANAFSYCTGLTDIYCNIKEPLYGGFWGVNNTSNITLHVPASSIDDYYDANSWKGFGAYVTLDGRQIDKQEVVVNGIKYQIALNAKVIPNNYTGDITIPSTISVNGKSYSVTSIGENAFSGCTGLTSVSIPASVTSIGRSAFSGCSGLSTLSLPSVLKIIDAGAFYGCKNITSIVIPNSVSNIGKEAFRYCSGLQSVSMGNSVQTIGSWAFANCDGLTGVNITDLTAWCDIVFEDGAANPLSKAKHIYMNGSEIKNLTIPGSVTAIKDYAFGNASSITSVSFPAILTSIGSSAFSGCSGLTSVTIPSSVTSIGSYAFSGCSGLTSVNITDGITTIPSYAFNHCTSLTSITIPSSVNLIGDYAFSGCSSLNMVISESEDPFTLNYRAFENNSPTCVLRVPAGTRDAYLNAGWNRPTAFPGGIIDESEPNIIYLITGSYFTAKTLENIDISFYVNNATARLVTVRGNYSSSSSSVSAIDKSTTGSITIPQTVTYGGKEYTVAYIGSSAFSGCSGLISVTIPGSVTSIESSAFSGCTGLISVTIPGSVTSIESSAFSGCSSLTSIIIPSSVTSIGSSAFSGCTGELTINCNIPDAFENSKFASVIVGEGVTSIGNRAFDKCSSITSITLPSSLTSIGVNAFKDCSNLSDLTIPNSVTSIGSGAFYGTAWYNSQPNGLVYAGRVAYQYKGTMPANTQIVVMNGTISICSDAFSGRTGLTSISLPASLTSIGSQAFESCNGLSSIIIPNSVTSIGNYAFYGCHGLTSITLPESLTTIDNNSFSCCSSLTSIEIPNSVTSIGSSAFSGCSSLTTITIPSSVTTIGSYAFNCPSLTEVKADITSPLSIDSYTFSNRADATLVVPWGSKDNYKRADYWKRFKRIVEDIYGDVNGDEDVDVVDVVDIARYVVGTPAETFVPILADIDNSGEVNIGDAVALVNEIAGDQNFVKAKRAPSRTAESEDALSLTQTDEGLALVLANQRDYTAFQFDLIVPEGTDVARMLLNAERKQKHQLLYNKIGEGHYRVAALSTSNRTFQGNDGELLSFALNSDSDSEIAIRNIHFFDTEGGEYMFNEILYEGTTTGIAVTPSTTPMDGAFYTIDGRRIGEKPTTKGLYIVNGKKVVIK